MNRPVTTGTFILALAAAAYVLRFGSNVPIGDEWCHISDVLAHPFSFDWLIAHHNEHRYPLGKLLWVSALLATGYDFRAGMFITIGLLTAASLLLTAAAKRVRGWASIADLIVPALLLHWGHSFNLLMGYQVVFSLFVFGFAGTVWAAVNVTPGNVTRPAMIGGLFAVIAVQSGGFGVAAAAALVAWLGGCVVLRIRDRGPRWQIESMTLLILPIAIASYTGWVVATFPDERQVTVAHDILNLPVGILRFLACGLISIPTSAGSRVPLLAFTAVCYLTASWALLRDWLQDRDRRRNIAGLAMLLAAELAIAVAVAWGRGCIVGDRFVSPSALGLCLVWVILAGWGPRTRFTMVVASITAVILLGLNVPPAVAFGQLFRQSAKNFEADLRAGLPPVYIIGRHGGSLTVFLGDLAVTPLGELRDRGIGPFKTVAADPLLLTAPITLEPVQLVSPPPMRVPLPAPGRHVAGLRVHVEQKILTSYQLLWLRWRERSTGAGHAWQVMPKFLPGKSTVVFKIDGDPVELSIEPDGTMQGLTLTSAEWLVERD
jgi:hypothetical protein